MAQQTSIGTSRRKSPSLRTEHRNRLASVVWAARKNGGKFKTTQDFRTAKNYAGVEFTCDAYLDRVEAVIVEDIILSGSIVEDIAP